MILFEGANEESYCLICRSTLIISIQLPFLVSFSTATRVETLKSRGTCKLSRSCKSSSSFCHSVYVVINFYILVKYFKTSLQKLHNIQYKSTSQQRCPCLHALSTLCCFVSKNRNSDSDYLELKFFFKLPFFPDNIFFFSSGLMMKLVLCLLQLSVLLLDFLVQLLQLRLILSTLQKVGQSVQCFPRSVSCQQ